MHVLDTQLRNLKISAEVYLHDFPLRKQYVQYEAMKINRVDLVIPLYVLRASSYCFIADWLIEMLKTHKKMIVLFYRK